MTYDYVAAQADAEADRRGQDTAMEIWLETRVEEVMDDPEMLEFAFELYGSCDDYDLMREVAYEAARTGSTDAQRQLHKRMGAIALAWAKQDWRDRG